MQRIHRVYTAYPGGYQCCGSARRLRDGDSVIKDGQCAFPKRGARGLNPRRRTHRATPERCHALLTAPKVPRGSVAGVKRRARRGESTTKRGTEEEQGERGFERARATSSLVGDGRGRARHSVLTAQRAVHARSTATQHRDVRQGAEPPSERCTLQPDATEQQNSCAQALAQVTCAREWAGNWHPRERTMAILAGEKRARDVAMQ